MEYKRYMMVIGLVSLAACSGNTVKNTLGLDRGSPDEFRVVSRPPLSVPPQFNLRPPSTSGNDTGPGQLPTSGQAQSLLTGGTATPAVNTQVTGGAVSVKPAAVGSPAESAFLKNVGAGQADPTVRDKIAEDQMAAQQTPPEEISWYNFWSATPAKKEPLVNANQESQRIKTDADSGQPVTTGETPVVKDRDTGLLGKIFGY